ncbi:NAD(P)/FAD-dependent oxidoreductase [Xanthovirga aplysinae]|uniref:NAD(P)/FAD-dependent oxidoreductase n=1 Tax=Xanthovirga aplysinae TaxID=2529853 RepID=UPI0012BB9692|nr:FAD-dependent oxidoreductase [Xanthovirga aplysinae]MTI31054.1 FAD-dependent oxidoreductase [Xanthovirga aplysinae]
MAENPRKVIVIGGGIIGVCSAYYLWEAGYKVQLIEKDEVGMGCSYGNAGLIVPSHIVPLAAPGMISQGLKWLLNPESPFYIKPRLNKRLISWLWLFYKSANAKHVQQSGKGLRDLNMLSRSLFQEISKVEGINFELKKKGLLMLSKSTKYHEEEMEVAHMANELGMEAHEVGPEEIQALNPDIKIDAYRGVHYLKDAHIQPGDFVKSLVKYLEKQGVEFHRGTEVHSFLLDGSKVKGVITSKGEVEADDFVLACGALSPHLSSQLNLNLPMQSGKGYSVTIENAQYKPVTPLILMEAKVAVTPMGRDLRFAGTMEIAGDQLNINQRRVKGILNAIPNYLPEYDRLEEAYSNKAWSGLRPCSPDGLPYIGKFQKFNNVVAATGHAMMGVSLGPVTGKLVAEIIAGERTSVDIKAYNPDRFN